MKYDFLFSKFNSFIADMTADLPDGYLPLYDSLRLWYVCPNCGKDIFQELRDVNEAAGTSTGLPVDYDPLTMACNCGGEEYEDYSEMRLAGVEIDPNISVSDLLRIIHFRAKDEVADMIKAASEKSGQDQADAIAVAIDRATEKGE